MDSQIDLQKHSLQADVNQLTENMEKLSVEPTKKATLAKRLEAVYSWEEAINEMKLCREKQYR